MWAKKLADPSDKKNEGSYALEELLTKLDSTKVFNFLDELGRQSPANDHYFIARYNCIKAREIRVHNIPEPESSALYKDSIKKQVTRLLEQAMDLAFIEDDNYLEAYVSSIYADAMNAFHLTEKAVMYMMYSAELYEKVHMFGLYRNYIVLGEMLWRVREYEKSIHYTKIAIPLLYTAENGHYKYRDLYVMMCNNTIGLSFHRMGQYDSAMLYYEKGLQMAPGIEDKKFGSAWQNIISGNIAQVNFAQGKFNKALPVFLAVYQYSNKEKYYDEAANSLQWAAKTNLVLGNKAEALKQIRKSFQLLLTTQLAANYRQNAYQTASDIFKSLGENDSALYYSIKYNSLHDSLEKIIYLSSVDISQLRLNNERNKYNIQHLERRKNDQIEKRNEIIIGVLLLSCLILLGINRQRQKSKYMRELDHSEKIRIEGEMEAAKEQLKMFTNNMVDKIGLIERLESQLKNKDQTQEEQELITGLANQTILTDDDWIKFKIIFEKIHPGFFNKITTRFDNITQAEQRMAALTLLHFTTKQEAAMLGISPNSVIKSKQRLRQRFGLENAQEIEAFVASL